LLAGAIDGVAVNQICTGKDPEPQLVPTPLTAVDPWARVTLVVGVVVHESPPEYITGQLPSANIFAVQARGKEVTMEVLHVLR
jgi:hypothetical protein